MPLGLPDNPDELLDFLIDAVVAHGPGSVHDDPKIEMAAGALLKLGWVKNGMSPSRAVDILATSKGINVHLTGSEDRIEVVLEIVREEEE